jgi:IS30 family transposase
MKKYERLTFSERVKIESYLKIGKSQIEIALLIDRPKCTISREIKRNSASVYKAEIADFLYKIKSKHKHKGNKILYYPLLEYYILLRLRQGWSPEQIANRLRKIKSNNKYMQISHESIYTYIYLKAKGELRKELISYLRQEKSMRKRPEKRSKEPMILDRVGIEERPAEVADRIIPGHWESDLIIGKDNKSAIGTIVERTTRYVIMVKLKDRSTLEVRKAFAQEFKELPTYMRKTLTHDNGLEMASHKLFTADTQMKVYFAHPYSPWERGTNENTNMLIRDFFPKGTDFNTIPSGKIKNVQELLNNRPRKTLDWSTPNEVFNGYILKGKAGITYTKNVI